MLSKLSVNLYAGQYHNIKIGSKSFEIVEQFNYLSTTPRNQYCKHEEIKANRTHGTPAIIRCPLSSSFLFKTIKSKQNHNFACCFAWVWSLVSHTEGWTSNEVPATQCNVCGRNLIIGLTPAASPRVDISSACKVGQKLGVSLPLLTCTPSAWPSRLLYRRGRKFRRNLWNTLYYSYDQMKNVMNGACGLLHSRWGNKAK